MGQLLKEIGTTQSDGTLALDSDKLDEALDSNFDALSEFMAGDNGLMGRLDAKLEPYAQTGGIIEGRTTALQNTLSSIVEQRERLETRLASLETRLLAQFNAMDTLVANLSSTGDFLSSQLSSLPGVVKKDS